MEGIVVEVGKLIVRPQPRSAFAIVELRETAGAFPAAWQAVMRLRVPLTVVDEDNVKTLCERACAEASAYFDEDCN